MEDIRLLLSYIETEIKEGKKAIFSKKVVVDGNSILDFVNRIRASLPEATGEILVERARREAQEIIDLAEKRKATLIDNSVAMKDARERAEKIMMQAAENKFALERELEQNIMSVLSSVRGCLTQTTQWIDDTGKSVQEKLNGKK